MESLEAGRAMKEEGKVSYEARRRRKPAGDEAKRPQRGSASHSFGILTGNSMRTNIPYYFSVDGYRTWSSGVASVTNDPNHQLRSVVWLSLAKTDD
jgi:hypothetical protein